MNSLNRQHVFSRSPHFVGSGCCEAMARQCRSVVDYMHLSKMRCAEIVSPLSGQSGAVWG
ncbi:MAG: hypothetical protein II985_00585 [Alistipes sp.]|nr:hypothetical protein [Alistipes sp.]